MRPGIEATSTLLIQFTVHIHTLNIHIKRLSQDIQAQCDKCYVHFILRSKLWVSTIMKFFNTQTIAVTIFLLMHCAAGKTLWLYLYCSLESSPLLPQVFSPEGWRTRGGATMLVQVCLVHRCCTLGEWPKCSLTKWEGEPTFSVFQTTHSTTPSTHTRLMLLLRDFRQRIRSSDCW